MNKHWKRTKVDMTTYSFHWHTYTLVVVGTVTSINTIVVRYASCVVSIKIHPWVVTALFLVRLIEIDNILYNRVMALDSYQNSLVFILLLDIEMLTIVLNFNIYEDICHAQPSSEHFSS